MPISKTPKRKVENEQSVLDRGDENIFAQLEAQRFGPDDEGNEEKVSSVEADLRQQLEDSQKRMEELRRANEALLASPQSFRSQTTEQIKPVLKELPDQALDPDGFARTVAENAEARVNASTQQKNNEAQHQAELKEKMDGLWEDFSDTYPDLTGDEDKLEFTVSKVVKRAKRKGLDIERYMFVTSDRFLSDVANEMEKTFGKKEVEDEEDAPRSRNRAAPARRARRHREDDDEDRTSGIFGGNESGGRPARGKGNEEDGPGMIDDMHALQRKTGFF